MSVSWLSVCSLLSWQLDLVLLQSLGRLGELFHGRLAELFHGCLGEAPLIAVSLNSFMAVLNSSHCRLLDVGSFGVLSFLSW